jgi:hypothetical protein
MKPITNIDIIKALNSSFTPSDLIALTWRKGISYRYLNKIFKRKFPHYQCSLEKAYEAETRYCVANDI